MIEILPIRHITSEDGQIFGRLNSFLGSLARANLAIPGIVVTPPGIKLQTTLAHYDLGNKDLFEQSLMLVKKEFNDLPIPENLSKELEGKHKFFVRGIILKSKRKVWETLLDIWIEEIKQRLWYQGFTPNLTQGLEPQVVGFVTNVKTFGVAYFDDLKNEVVIKISLGNLNESEARDLNNLVKLANKKLVIPYFYEWVLEKGIKLSKVSEFVTYESKILKKEHHEILNEERKKTATKIFLDLSNSLTVEKNVDGIYIVAEKFSEDLLFRVVEVAKTFPASPILVKLADVIENVGGVRGTLRLLHQKSLFNPLCQILTFTRHKKGLTNVHLVIPYIRSTLELVQLKRELAVKKLVRKHSFQFYLEVCVPENIINIEEYIAVGIDGIVLNLDELISHLYGFDLRLDNMSGYKSEINGLIKFLERSFKIIHRNKLPVIAYGKILSNTNLMEFLVENGVYGVVVERYEAHSINDLLYQIEKKVVVKRSS